MPTVLICDDSVTMRIALRRTMLMGGLAVVGEAATGEEAVALAKQLKPDLITMDVMLPDLDGFQATQAILANGPTRIVIVSAAGEALQADLSFRALQSGAMDLVEKPESGDAAQLQAWGKALAANLIALAALPIGQRPELAARPRPHVGARRIAIFAIAVSTGGPPALAKLMKGLSPSLSYPIVVVQHIAAGFTNGLANWLATQTPLKVKVAEGGELAAPGTIWLAKDRSDIVLHEGGRLRILPNLGGVCPNGDRLLSSVAERYGKEGAGAVLTGMGADGAQGLLAMKKAGALTFAQESSSCVVDGMPASAVALGAAEQRLTLEELNFVMAELGR
jgi:two-component system chemotaxis response regulator CheB